MPKLINWELIREPVNWAIVVLMIAIATFALHLIMGDEPPAIFKGL